MDQDPIKFGAINISLEVSHNKFKLNEKKNNRIIKWYNFQTKKLIR